MTFSAGGNNKEVLSPDALGALYLGQGRMSCVRG